MHNNCYKGMLWDPYWRFCHYLWKIEGKKIKISNIFQREFLKWRQRNISSEPHKSDYLKELRFKNRDTRLCDKMEMNFVITDSMGLCNEI